MKKLFILAAVFSLAFSFTAATAQTQNPVFTLSTFKWKPTPSNSTSATTNTGTDTLSLFLPGFYNVVGFQPVVTKVSGTVAGSVILYGSIDGVHYVALGDTLTNTNQTTNQTIFTHTNPVWVYYRAIQTGSGTMATTTQIYYTVRRQ